MNKHLIWLSALLFIVALSVSWGGCNPVANPPAAPPSNDQPSNDQQAPMQPNSDSGGETEVEVVGSALFGSQCPFGSFSHPQPVSVELLSCPIGLSSVELLEPLEPLILQADCKGKIMDVRGATLSYPATTWELRPDGTFDFTVTAGQAKLKDDGSGTGNCVVPLIAEMWGKIDCTDRDRVGIHLETAWRLDSKSIASGSASPSPSPSPSSNPRPSTRPSPFGFPLTAIPSIAWERSQPSPLPSDPWPAPSLSPVPSPFPAPTPSSLPKCKLPPDCYFHNITRINQCS
jgi:hypothetical protein